MLIKMATLGALGYGGYRYFANTRTSQPRNAVAGGPLSAQARLQHSADAPTESRVQN